MWVCIFRTRDTRKIKGLGSMTLKLPSQGISSLEKLGRLMEERFNEQLSTSDQNNTSTELTLKTSQKYTKDFGEKFMKESCGKTNCISISTQSLPISLWKERIMSFPTLPLFKNSTLKMIWSIYGIIQRFQEEVYLVWSIKTKWTLLPLAVSSTKSIRDLVLLAIRLLTLTSTF